MPRRRKPNGDNTIGGEKYTLYGVKTHGKPVPLTEFNKYYDMRQHNSEVRVTKKADPKKLKAWRASPEYKAMKAEREKLDKRRKNDKYGDKANYFNMSHRIPKDLQPK